MERHRLNKNQEYLRHLAYSTPNERLADELQDKVAEMIHSGASRDELYEDLKHLALQLRQDGRDELEDEVMDVMDVLAGWCAPSARL
jgi:hypothetical protein